MSVPKYYTAFIFSDPAKLHCTHKYLGELSAIQLARLAAGLNFVFLTYGIENIHYPKLDFSIPRTFTNDNKPISTLYATDGDRLSAHQFFADLRRQLDAFRKDEHPYSPHVTLYNPLDVAQTQLPFFGYALMCGDEIIICFKNAALVKTEVENAEPKTAQP